MTGDVDDVVGAGHHPKIAVFVLVSCIGGEVIAGKPGEVGLAVAFIVLPECRETTGRQWQLDDDTADLTGR